jgi:hypothetical protein
MTQARSPAPDKERKPDPSPSETPTSFHTQDNYLMDFNTPEFQEWMKGLSMGQRMRVQERMSIRNAIKRAEEAILALSDIEGHSYEIWEAASGWSLGHLRENENEDYLSMYGFKLADALHWKEVPYACGPQLHFSVNQHISRAGHNWYIVKCKISGLPNLADIEWQAPRRLGQLRIDLHHRAKDLLHSEIYEEKFQHARFAKFGGPPGTTARLDAWLGVLAGLINQGIAQPSVATLALVFFSAPLPDGVTPAVEKGFLRAAGDLSPQLDNHSHLGGSEVGY